MKQENYLLLAGTLFWVGLFVLFGGMAIAIALAERNPTAVLITVAAALACWIATWVLAYKGMDRFGKYGHRTAGY